MGVLDVHPARVINQDDVGTAERGGNDRPRDEELAGTVAGVAN